ncbi:asparaginase [Candidatus Woesearchaeota archaeon]|nr:asparaginase [Candidatus Woesearchaeota archaeon]
MTKETIDLLIVTTGGSIDAYMKWPSAERPGWCIEILNRETQIPEIVKHLGIEGKVEYVPICMKNSDDITDADRDAMYKAIAKSPQESVVITHGLNTLKQTQIYLERKLRADNPLTLPKTIVLVGSKTPDVAGHHGEGIIQVGYAIASSLTARHGVYRVDNGRLLDVQGRKYDHDQFRNATG